MSKGERWTAVFVPLNDNTGLGDVHYTWGATFFLEALMAISADKHYIVWDHDAAPVVLYEVQDLWWFPLNLEVGRLS